MQIINRLIKQEFVVQKESDTDKRKRVLGISEKGVAVLGLQMDKNRKATEIVAGDLFTMKKWN